MSQNPSINRANQSKTSEIPWGWIITAGSVFAVGVTALYISSSQGAALRQTLDWMLGLSTVNVTWYLTRIAGIIAYLLLWISTAWGIAIPSKFFDRVLHRSITFEFHQFISLLGLGFLALHMLVLLADQYMPYSVAQLLVPFISPYRPIWVGVGVIAFYLLVLVTVTFYIRQRIGMKAFRYIHYTSLLAYLGATVHGIYSGTDTPLSMMMLMYAGTFLVIVFLFVYWITVIRLDKREKAALNPRQAPFKPIQLKERVRR
jgi:sulfoxide reductase heme-binding subunit YedZ